jgi:hypothetical protein
LIGGDHIRLEFGNDALHIPDLVRDAVEQPPLYGRAEFQHGPPVYRPGLAGRKHEIVHGVLFVLIGWEERESIPFDDARGPRPGIEDALMAAFAQYAGNGERLKDMARERPAGDEESGHGSGCARLGRIVQQPRSLARNAFLDKRSYILIRHVISIVYQDLKADVSYFDQAGNRILPFLVEG